MKFLLGLLVFAVCCLSPASYVTKKLTSIKAKRWQATVEYVQFKGATPLIRFANREIAGKAKAILATFVTDAKELGSKERSCTLDVAQVVHLDSPSVLSVHFGMDSYLGGAYPNVNFATMNFAIVNGRPALLKVKDVVASPQEFAKAVSAGLKADLSKRDESQTALSFDLSGHGLESFVITRKGIRFLYDQAPHAVGSLFADLPWSRLKGLKRDGPLKAVIPRR